MSADWDVIIIITPLRCDNNNSNYNNNNNKRSSQSLYLNPIHEDTVAGPGQFYSAQKQINLL